MSKQSLLIGYWNRSFSFAIGALATLIVSSPAQARPLQIIHTNDLHSHLEKGDSDETGGYAAVKAVMDQLRFKAQQDGIDTLVLDAGDFSEGTEFYLADEGRQTFRTMDSMGYDAIALGNHDWLIGTEELDWLLGTANMQTPILSANLSTDSRYQQIHRHILPHVELKRAGSRVAVMGLSTDEFVYRWRVQNGDIADPISTARDELLDLRTRNDFVIALTHLGTNVDLDLVKKTGGIDLVVGGHSHTTLTAPLFAKDGRGVQVPIVQTGQHGEYVGDLLVDVEPGKPLKVLHYQLVPVKKNELQDRKIASMVGEARTQLEKRYGPEWLYDVVGYSEVPLERPLYAPSIWGAFCGEAMRETAGADFSLDVGEFYGNSQPAGPISRETIIQGYPRVFDLHKPSGWNVWSIKAPGWLIQIVISEVAKTGQYLNSSGLTYDVKTDNQGQISVSHIKVQGKKLSFFREYTIGVSEGLGRGTMEISFLLRAFFDPIDTGVPFWSAIEDKIKRSGGVIHAPQALLK